MPRTRTSLLVALLAAALAACASDSTTEVFKTHTATATVGEEPTEAREITLTSGDSLSVSVGVEGDVHIVATIADGKPSAGRYTSTSTQMLETATAAKNALGEPNTVVRVTVDATGTIVAISYEVTL